MEKKITKSTRIKEEKRDENDNHNVVGMITMILTPIAGPF
jgi:hypothetical protein